MQHELQHNETPLGEYNTIIVVKLIKPVLVQIHIYIKIQLMQ